MTSSESQPRTAEQPSSPMTDLTQESLAAALEVVEAKGLIVMLGLGDPEQRTDFTTVPAEVATAILAALASPAPEPPPWPDMRPDYQRIADAVSTCGSIREAVAWIEEEARRDLRAAQPAPDLDVERLLRAWTTHRIRSQHGQDGHPECGPTRCVEAIANTYRHTLMPFQARESGGEP